MRWDHKLPCSKWRGIHFTYKTLITSAAFWSFLSSPQLYKIKVNRVNLQSRKLETGRHWSILPKQTNSTVLPHLFRGSPLLNQQTICWPQLSLITPVLSCMLAFRTDVEALQSLLNTGRKSNQPSVLIACRKHMLSVRQRQDPNHVCRPEELQHLVFSLNIAHRHSAGQ